jgi:hypothetical protein
MDRIFHKAKNNKEAELWDIQQQNNMTSGQRQEVAKELKKRFYSKYITPMRPIKNE